MLKRLILVAVFLYISNLMATSCAAAPAAAHATLAANTSTAAHRVQFQLGSDSLTLDSQTVKLTAEEQEFITRINAERSSRGLNALTPDPMLVSIARGHSREMCDLNYFDHHSPTAGIRTPMDRYIYAVHRNGDPTPDYALCGENIFYCSILNDQYNVAYGHKALMNSPGHRANILEPRYTKVGVGIYVDSQDRFWVTEMFLRDKE